MGYTYRKPHVQIKDVFIIRRTIRGHRSRITDLVINDQNSILMSSSEDGWIMFWDITPLIRDPSSLPCYHYLACCCSHKRFICQLRYDTVIKLLFSVADDGFVYAWNPEAVNPLNPYTKRYLTERELCVFSLPHDSTLVQARKDDKKKNDSVMYCDISWDGRFIVTGASDGLVRIWRIPYIQRNRAGMTQQVLHNPNRSLVALDRTV